MMILILSLVYARVVQSGVLLHNFAAESPCAFLFAHTCDSPRSLHPLRFHYTLYTRLDDGIFKDISLLTLPFHRLFQVLLDDAHSAADVSVASNEMRDRSQDKCNPIVDSNYVPSEYK